MARAGKRKSGRAGVGWMGVGGGKGGTSDGARKVLLIVRYESRAREETARVSRDLQFSFPDCISLAKVSAGGADRWRVGLSVSLENTYFRAFMLRSFHLFSRFCYFLYVLFTYFLYFFSFSTFFSPIFPFPFFL